MKRVVPSGRRCSSRAKWSCPAHSRRYQRTPMAPTMPSKASCTAMRGLRRHCGENATGVEEAANALLGVGLIASPWVLDYRTQSAWTYNTIIVGVLVAALALWAMLKEQTNRQRVFDRNQTK